MKETTKMTWKVIAVTALTAILGGLFSMNSKEFYQTLVKPPLAPPSGAFPIVWGILYVCMALAMILYFRKKPEEPVVFWVYVINLVLNALWPLFFFALGKICFSVFILLGMIVINLILIAELKTFKTSFYLYLPYLLWQIFALYLNLAFCFLN